MSRLVLDRFALRQFDLANKAVQTHIHYQTAEFMKIVTELYQDAIASGKNPLVDGYAPFCKHFFVPNFVNATCSYAKITEENKKWLKSDYIARTEKELPVLCRWFSSEEVAPPVASHLDLILYSREQINKENEATGTPLEMIVRDGVEVVEDAPWGIISIKPQFGDIETPMTPITAMRNALPVAEGGSGVALNHSDYLAAVAFWKVHASISNH